TYEGDRVEGAIQIHATNSLFAFVNAELDQLIQTLLGDTMDATPIPGGVRINFCMPRDTSAGITICTGDYNCRQSDSSTSNDGCNLPINLTDFDVTTRNHQSVRVGLNVEIPRTTIKAKNLLGLNCAIKFRISTTS